MTETNKYKLMKRVVKRMRDLSAMRSFNTWRDAFMNSKHIRVQTNLEEKCRESEELSFKIRTMKADCQKLAQDNHRLNNDLMKCDQFKKIVEDDLLKHVVARYDKRLALSRSFNAFAKFVFQTKLRRISQHLDQKCQDIEQLHSKIQSVTAERFPRNMEELISAKVRVDALEKENSVLRQQAESIKSVQNAVDVKMLKQQLSDATGELALKNESLSSLEKRIEAQNRDIDSLESCISKHRETQNALEKEVALSAVHSSMLFRELKEARSKLVLTSEEALKFQQQHSDLLKKVDGTSGSIQALWKEREFDLEVNI